MFVERVDDAKRKEQEHDDMEAPSDNVEDQINAMKMNGSTQRSKGRLPSLAVNLEDERSVPEGHHLLWTPWTLWYLHRTPGQKIHDYEKATKYVATFSSVEQFFAVYAHLKRPNEIPHISDYHIFRKGIKPIWEDPLNVNGGKWVLRLRKGFASMFWESLLLALIGGEFGDAAEDITGVVLSVRNAEDILSIWNSSSAESYYNFKIK